MATSTCMERSVKPGEENTEPPPTPDAAKPEIRHKKQHSKDLLHIKTDVLESKFLLKQRKTFKAAPPSVLQSVKDFLPLMSSANQELEQKMKDNPREEFDIENVTKDAGPVIEMDLAVFQDNSEESDSDYDLDSDEERTKTDNLCDGSDITLPCREVTEDTMKFSNTQRKRPAIVELNTDESDSIEKSVSR